MDCYIVRIYRRDEKDSRNIVGLVESVGIEQKTPFKGSDELLSIIEGREELGRQRKKRDESIPL